ncbi:MAG: hypothetical protein GY865_01270 [candidate division Zixibacteria bacterium]|nr:hypothetical protein [candidate division Zixibacteria bacterium]
MSHEVVDALDELMESKSMKDFHDLLHKDSYELWKTIRSRFIVQDKILKEKYFGKDGGSALRSISYSDGRKLLDVLRYK